MKRILITGANSYIGTSFAHYMSKWPDKYEIDTIDMTDKDWKGKNFKGYDTVFHVAGIAHADTGKASEETKALYYKVNRDLTIQTAEKAKADGVKQFVFMSSIIVYGRKNTIITKETIPRPDNFYGDSKLKAEKGILSLQCESFHVVVLRPPMIYGKSSKGNYPKLAKLAKKTPAFPNIKNRRSMIHISNLSEFIRLIIENNESGTFFPSNSEYINTFDLVKEIAKGHGKKVRAFNLFNPLIRLFSKRVNIFNKLFGDLIYDKSMSAYDDFSYCVNDFAESIRKTER